MKLKDEADLIIPEFVDFSYRHALDVFAGVKHAAGGRKIQGAHEIKKRALARTRTADDGNEFTVFNRQGNTFNHLAGRLSEFFDDIFQDKAHRHYSVRITSMGERRPAALAGRMLEMKQDKKATRKAPM